ncbi:MAG: hypothetical protein MK135_03665 [Polyangiaceae bacterium]|nr:hypothetical protein [Polyangiaceae bacterium]
MLAAPGLRGYFELTSEAEGLVFGGLVAFEFIDRVQVRIAMRRYEEGAHGDKEGLELANGDLVSWAEFVEHCRPINIATKNNLLVTVAACFGLHAITRNTIKEVAPFSLLIGPEGPTSQRVMDDFTAFYAQILEHGDGNVAKEKLPEDFQLFAAEKAFVEGYAIYVREEASGKGLRERNERLVTATMHSRMSLRNRRRLIKKHTKPDKD